MKECTKCKEVKELSCFYIFKNKPYSPCKACLKLERDAKKDITSQKFKEKYLLNPDYWKQRVYDYRDKKRIALGKPKLVKLPKRERHNILIQKRSRIERNQFLRYYRKAVFRKFEIRSRALMHKVFKLNKENTDYDILTYIGCDTTQLKEHIQRQFIKGMTLDNYGLWEIDHIMPFAILENIDELKANLHYTNLQPLWRIDNTKKNSKLFPHSKLDIANYF